MSKIWDYPQIVEEFNKERKGFLEPGVIRKSVHYLRGGSKANYYFDFDVKTIDPHMCRIVRDSLCRKILEINTQQKIDFLAFIEKRPGGTTGAIRFAAALSIELGIPNFIIRQTKEIISEQVSLTKNVHLPAGLKLLETESVLVTDHITAGGEALRAIETVTSLGGHITDVITYTLKYEDFRRNMPRFKEHGVNVYSIHDLRDQGDGYELTEGSTIIAAEEI